MTTTESPNLESQDRAEPYAAASKPRRRPGRRLLALAGAAVLVVALAAFLLIGTLGGGDEALKGSSGETFNLTLPRGWRALSQEELATLPGKPVGVVRREDGKGFLVIRREGRPPGSIKTFSKQLDAEFKKRLPDFQKRTTRSLKIRAGRAFFYSYIRRRKGTVHSVVVAPAPKGSYVLNTVAKGGEEDVARQLGRMIVSFDS